MDKFVTCDGVAVISSDARLRFRAIELLGHLNVNLLEFLSLAEFRHSSVPQYAVVMIEDCLNYEALDYLRNLRQCQNLVLISQTENPNTIATALYNGGHFYFDITESDSLLTARLQAALRIHRENKRSNIIAPPYNFDVQRRQVYLHSRPVELSPMEFNFALYLFSRPEEVIADSELMNSVWSLPGVLDTRRVDTAAYRIRKKMRLGSHPSDWELRRIRKVGFQLLASTANSNLMEVEC